MKKIIKVPNIDSYIWNVESKILDIAGALLSGHEIIIDLDGEGGCVESLGLYKLLDKMCETLTIDPTCISIRTANPLERHSKYGIINVGRLSFLYHNPVPIKIQKVFDEQLKHFGIFIGRSNWNRLFLASTIFKNYKDKSILSFHYDTGVKDNNCGFDSLTFNLGVSETADLSNELLKNFPVLLEEIKTYPVVHPDNLGILKFYNSLFVDVVCETYFTGKSFFPTEKTSRPIKAKTPFIVFGPTGYLSNLKKLGFKTFSDYWDEGYDDYSGIHRAKLIEELLGRLSLLSVNDLQVMYNSMESILKHNEEVLSSLTNSKFYDTFKNE